MASDTTISTTAQAQVLQLDDPKEADAARNRVRSKGRWLLSASPKQAKLPLRNSDGNAEASALLTRPTMRTLASAEVTPAINDITLDDALLPSEDNSKDVYRWAIVYENQRGVTVFSVPYFSSASLLPIDPPPFTLPTTKPMSRTEQPPLTLRTFPLPSGAWKWVSSQWMIDMRSDGTAGYDGYEYNWVFRKHGWSAQGNATAWVRRRRWVRLMMRPGAERRKDDITEEIGLGEEEVDENGDAERELAASCNLTVGAVWKGDVHEDWIRCRTALRKAGTDGRRIELWHSWLGVPVAKSRVKQWTEDNEPMPSEKEAIRTLQETEAEPAADLELVKAVIRANVSHHDSAPRVRNVLTNRITGI